MEVAISRVFDPPSPESLQTMRLQETTGFAQEVLADYREDVWNERIPPATISQDHCAIHANATVKSRITP